MTLLRDRDANRRKRGALRTAWSALKLLWKVLNGLAVFAASVAAVFGVWTWLSEAKDREQEREVRERTLAASEVEQEVRTAALVDSAYSAIAAAEQNGTDQLESTPRLAWAVQTLAKLGHPVEIRGGNIWLDLGDVECLDLTVHASKGLTVVGKFQSSTLTLFGQTIYVSGEFIHSSIIDRGGRDANEPRWIEGVFEASNIFTRNPARFYVRGHHLKILTNRGEAHVTGAMPPLASSNEALVGAEWPTSGTGWGYDLLESTRWPSKLVEMYLPDGEQTGDFASLCPDADCTGDKPPVEEIYCKRERPLHANIGNDAKPESGWETTAPLQNDEYVADD